MGKMFSQRPEEGSLSQDEPHIHIWSFLPTKHFEKQVVFSISTLPGDWHTILISLCKKCHLFPSGHNSSAVSLFLWSPKPSCGSSSCLPDLAFAGVLLAHLRHSSLLYVSSLLRPAPAGSPAFQAEPQSLLFPLAKQPGLFSLLLNL